MVNRIEQLKHSLSVLAMEPSEQISYIRSIISIDRRDYIDNNTNVDELALEFEDAYISIGGLLRDGLVTEDAEKALCRLDELLQELSGAAHESFWTIGALRGDSRWGDIRNIAAECLNKIQHRALYQ